MWSMLKYECDCMYFKRNLEPDSFFFFFSISHYRLNVLLLRVIVNLYISQCDLSMMDLRC